MSLGAKLLCDRQTVVVEVNHDDLRRRIKLRCQEYRKADRACANNGDRVSGLDVALEYAALESGRQGVAQHHHGFFIAIFGDVIEASVGVRDADVLGLRAVDEVA